MDCGFNRADRLSSAPGLGAPVPVQRILADVDRRLELATSSAAASTIDRKIASVTNCP